MLLLDGKIVRDSRVGELRKAVRELGFAPVLGIVQAGHSERSRAYISAKRRFADEIGAHVELAGVEGEASTDELLLEVRRLTEDPSVNGVIVQMPLSPGMDHAAALQAIDPEKDVDGLTAWSLRSLLENDHRGFLPATAKGILSLLDYYGVDIEGKRVVIVGRSVLVGKATALAFLNRNATVTVCHRHTKDLPLLTKQAEILIVGAGKQGLVGPEHVSPGQIVVDVGINTSGEKLSEEISAPRLVGDVQFEKVKTIVGAISPVPGGVGPMTVLSLFENLVEAARRQAKNRSFS